MKTTNNFLTYLFHSKLKGWQRCLIFLFVLLFIIFVSAWVVSINHENGIYKAVGSDNTESGDSAVLATILGSLFLVLPLLVIAFLPVSQFFKRLNLRGPAWSIAIGTVLLLFYACIVFFCIYGFFFWFVHDHYLISLGYLVPLLVISVFYWIDVKQFVSIKYNPLFIAYLIILLMFSVHSLLAGERLSGMVITVEEVARQGLIGTWGDALSVVVASDGTIYVGSFYGIFRSTDRGANWVYLGKIGKGGEYGAFALAVTSDGVIYSRTYRGVFMSADGGANWSNASQTIAYGEYTPKEFLSSLAIAPDGSVYAGTEGGVIKSTDRGANWTRTSSLVAYRIAIAMDGAIYATTRNGLSKSIDNSTNWTEISRMDANIAVAPDGAIYAATSKGIFRSTDKGSNWAEVGQWSNNGYIRSLAVATEGTIYIVTDKGLFMCRSSDLICHGLHCAHGRCQQ